MGEPAGEATLGALLPDSARCAVVVSDDGELAVALRERVDRGFVLVRDVRPDEAMRAVAASQPWPWMVVGNVATPPVELTRYMQTHAVLVFWHRITPSGLPIHARVFERFSDIVGAIDHLANRAVGGMRLAPGLGVMMPDGECVPSAALQALVSHHPIGFRLPPRDVNSAERLLARHNAGWGIARSHDGTVELVARTAATAGLAP